MINPLNICAPAADSTVAAVTVNHIEKVAQDSIPIVSEMAGKVLDFKGKTVAEIFSELTGNLVAFALKFFAALAVFLIARFLIRRVKKIMRRTFEKRQTEKSLAGFLTSLVNVVMIILLVVILVGMLGINTTSIAALLASGGLAIGMALSGTLQNFAGGVMILAFKPFKVGDYIETEGVQGTVNDITITSTKISTPDNKIIIVPNGKASSGIVNNYSMSGTRRVDWTVSISYGDDFELARKEVLAMFEGDGRILEEPATPVVYLSKMAESSIDISIRAWTSSDDYWNVFFEYNEKLYKELPKKGLHFPYPHLTVEIEGKS